MVYNSPGGREALKELAMPDCTWRVIIEPVSVNYLYTEDTFDGETSNYWNDEYGHCDFEAGSPIPKGEWVGDSYKPDIYIGTASKLLWRSNLLEAGGTDYTWKFYNTQLPYSLCLDNDISAPYYMGGGAGASIRVSALPEGSSAERLYSSIGNGTGIGIASIDITGFSLPPIHTFDGTNTPGNTEVPDAEKGTTGPCIIKKLYYTETLKPDGTVDTTADPEYYYFTRRNTTPYISIDEEEGYEIEQWKRSRENKTVRTKEAFESVDYLQIGSSSGVQSLMRTNQGDDKYLYILYKKTVVLDEEPSEYDFELQESQITKRVSFRNSSTTDSLIEHVFTWSSEAHSPTACASHGGYGHHLNCNTEWDVAPVTGVPHTHVNSCYDTPCSSFAFTDATVKLGIKLDNSSVNKAVISRRHKAIYNDTAVYDEDDPAPAITSNTHYGEFERTSSGATSFSKSNYNLIAVLFRGNDKLTLADWKNNATTKSYLTNIAYDSNYNFKSANTPQGTRKAGEEYTETTGTKFINRSPDNQTTYKATVGAHGTCGSTKSYTFTKADGTSSDYTIDNIKVNIKVFWANGIGPASSGSLPSTQVAGSASFYPYVRMRYDNNTQDDVKVYVLGQRKRTVTVYDYASVSISGGDSKLAINSSQYYSSLF